MVDVHVGHDQRLDTLDGEIQRQLIFVPRFVVALKLPQSISTLLFSSIHN